jgi:hypothetical protein
LGEQEIYRRGRGHTEMSGKKVVVPLKGTNVKNCGLPIITLNRRSATTCHLSDAASIEAVSAEKSEAG